MNLTDNQFIEILERSEKIIEKLLNELSNEQLKLIKKDIDNLPVNQKIMNQLIMDRVNYLKPKKLTKPISYFSSGELDFSNNDLFNFQQAKENSKKISKSISYFSSGELELLQNI